MIPSSRGMDLLGFPAGYGVVLLASAQNVLFSVVSSGYIQIRHVSCGCFCPNTTRSTCPTTSISSKDKPWKVHLHARAHKQFCSGNHPRSTNKAVVSPRTHLSWIVTFSRNHQGWLVTSCQIKSPKKSIKSVRCEERTDDRTWEISNRPRVGQGIQGKGMTSPLDQAVRARSWGPVTIPLLLFHTCIPWQEVVIANMVPLWW